MAGRALLLLLAFILSFGVVQLAGFLLLGAASLMPGAALPFVAVGGMLALSALQFFCAGFLFTLAAGMPWRLSGLFTWTGIGLCNMLAAGPGALSSGYLSAQFLTLIGAAHALLSGAAAWYGCLTAERQEDAPWAEHGRAMLLGFFNR